VYSLTIGLLLLYIENPSELLEYSSIALVIPFFFAGVVIFRGEKIVDKILVDYSAISLKKFQYEYDYKLQENLKGILSASYTNPEVALDYALRESDTLYCSFTQGKLVGFFFQRWSCDSISFEGKPIFLARMILGAVGSEHRKSGVFKQLLNQIQHDFLQRKKAGNCLIMYGRTGNILAYKALCGTFDSIQPKMNGARTKESSDIAYAINLKFFNRSTTKMESPFILKNTVKHNLSNEELDKIGSISKGDPNNVFDKLSIDIKAGDRLLYLIF
jgi:hypothetical protein